MPRRPSFASALSTALNPPKVDPWAVLGYEPACVPYLKGERPGRCGECAQEVFAAADEYMVIIGGAAAGGKTLGCLMWAIRACVEHPRIRIGAFRRSYPELRDSLLAELASYGFCVDLGCTFNQSEHELRFPNGSVILFRYAETLKDATRYQGPQFQGVVCDELCLFDWPVFTFLQTRIRTGRASIPVLGIRASCNPGGPSHQQVRAILEKTNYGERTFTNEQNREVRFVRAGLRDNPWINAEYAADLMGLPEKLRRAFLDGDWSSFEGAIFPELDPDRHRVRPMPIPSSWRRYAGIDWGFREPFACLHLAVDPDKRVWLYREAYATQVGESEQARRILEAESYDEADEPVIRYMDSACWATRGDAMSIAEAYQRAGCHVIPAGKGPGSRAAGYARIREALQDGPACPHHRALGLTRCPMLHAFTTLEHWWAEMTGLIHNVRAGNPEDSDPRCPDHLADATRYVISALGTGASWPVLDEAPAEAGYPNAYGAEVLEPFAGRFAVRQDSHDPWLNRDGAWADDDDIGRRIVRDARDARRGAGY